jgi:hypothetical protein
MLKEYHGPVADTLFGPATLLNRRAKFFACRNEVSTMDLVPEIWPLRPSLTNLR